MMRVVFLAAVALIGAFSIGDAAAQQPGASAETIAPPTTAERRPRAVVRFAPDRFDDLLWENDRVAHRLYGPALQAREPPSGSGVDVWGKRVRWPFMDRQLRTPSYHNDYGEGADFYDVGRSRGAGGLGIWFDNKLWTSRNFATYEILETGGNVASFRVTYAPWPVDVGRAVWETRTFSLPLGSNFTRMVSTISSDKPETLAIAIGIQKQRNASGAGTIVQDQASGCMIYWGPAHPEHGAIGVAVIADPALVTGFTQDAENYLMLLAVTPDQPFVYYMGSAWERGLDFTSNAAWEAHVRAQRPDFSRAH